MRTKVDERRLRQILFARKHREEDHTIIMERLNSHPSLDDQEASVRLKMKALDRQLRKITKLRTMMRSLAERVKINHLTGCWDWAGKLSSEGYSVIGGRHGHRVIYEILGETIPEGMVVRHSCDNKKCVNPDHLIVGTYKENALDCIERHPNPPHFGFRVTN